MYWFHFSRPPRIRQNPILMTSTERWQKAQKGERRSDSFRQDILTTEDSLRRLNQYWLVNEDFIDGVNVLAVGGGNGIIHGLEMASEVYSIDPLNPEYPFNHEESVASVIGGAGEGIPFQGLY